jgi:hypothetical protein
MDGWLAWYMSFSVIGIREWMDGWMVLRLLISCMRAWFEGFRLAYICNKWIFELYYHIT